MLASVERDHREQQPRTGTISAYVVRSRGGHAAAERREVAVGGVAESRGSIAVASETVAIACGTITSRNALE